MSKSNSRVMFQSADAGATDKKFEGYSNLKGAHDQQQKKIQRGAQQEMTKGLEEEYILNLQKQIVLMEHEIKFLKEREVDQKNKASGYETLLRDGIPLNEHFLALKNKYNNEKDILDKNVQMMKDEISKEENANKQRTHKIDILKREYEEISTKFKEYKDATAKQLKDLETKLFTEMHTRDVLNTEKQSLYEKVSQLKVENQTMNRQITKDKYHNNRADVEKEREKNINDIRQAVDQMCEKIEKEQNLLESEVERNNDKDLLKNQKQKTMDLKQEHNRIATDITVAENRINDLKNRQEMLNSSILDILKDKRRIDKHNMELEDRLSGRNVTDDDTKFKQKTEERKMKISIENKVKNLKAEGVILMEQIANEEARSKDVLDEKLKLEQELTELKEDLGKLTDKHGACREELIRLRVKNSQLDSQNNALTEEEAQLTGENEKLIQENGALEKQNSELKNKISETIQRIDINNLLKEIDIEEMQLLAKNNKMMNQSMEALITKWNYIQKKNEEVNNQE